MVRTRIAPSPTGELHIGTARTALVNWLVARKEGGKFVLRIDDTDKERSKHQYEDDIRESLEWLGLAWDEEYRQSNRSDLYKKYTDQLLASGSAFYCPHETSEEKTPHVCNERDGKGTEGIIRFKNDEPTDIAFQDVVRGEVKVDPKTLGDFSVARSPDQPLFVLATTVDDHDLNITHVIRGEDHISNIPKQILIQRALGFSEPIWAHIPLILGSDRSKLSKREAATSINAYKELGYLPDAMVNFLALMGWHPVDDTEIFSREELIKLFSLERMQKGGAIFDNEKLNWVNRQHIGKLSDEDIADLLISFIPYEVSRDVVAKVARVSKERMNALSDISESDFFFKDPEYDAGLLCWKGKQSREDATEKLDIVLGMLSGAEEANFIQIQLERLLMPIAEKEGKGELLWPLRVALTGKMASPGPFEVMDIIGREASIRRIKSAISRLP